MSFDYSVKKLESLERIAKARAKVCDMLRTEGLSIEQIAVFSGMSAALQWVCGDGGRTLERLMRGEKIQPGKTLKDLSPNIAKALFSEEASQ